MPQRQTTHKDLHKAFIGSAFSLAILFSAQPICGQNGAKPAKPGVVKHGAASAAEVITPKLRAIPESTLNPEKKQPQAEQKTAPLKKPANAASASTKANKTKKVTVVQPRLNNGLVPPPPPIAPIGMDTLGMFAQPVDYLSMKELEARKKELASRLNELSSIVGDGERQIRERKEHAELFESLYKEGVVSRKELEGAKREAGEIDRDLRFKQDEFESVKASMRAVNNRLAVLKKMEAKLNSNKQKNKTAAGLTKKKQ